MFHCEEINCFSILSQLNAWATGIVNLDEWNRSYLEHDTLITEIDGEIVGFADMDKDGYLDRLYVHKDYQSKGIATALVHELERRAQMDGLANVTSLKVRQELIHLQYHYTPHQYIIRGSKMDYTNLLFRFTQMSKDIFKNNLVGIYLHGSYAMGCFHPEKSDLDLLLVVDGDIPDLQKQSFMENVIRMNEEAPAKGIELSIVKREVCNPFVYPTPFVLHFSIAHLAWFKENPKDYVEKMNGIDKDLAAHFTIINHHAIVLYGAEVKEVFGKVPKLDYADSIWTDIKEAKTEILTNPMYITLNLCRVLGYLKDNLILSKKTGGEWGLENLPQEYHELIKEALICYQTGRKVEVDTKVASSFAEYMLYKIEERRDTLNVVK